MSYLRDLASGLRAAAGVLSPSVQKQTFEADERERLNQERFKEALVLQQTSPQAQLARQQMAEQNQMRGEIAQLGPNPDIGKVAQIAVKYDPKYAVELIKTREAAAQRIQTAGENLQFKYENLQRQRDADLARTQDRQQRLELDRQYKQQFLALQQSFAGLRAQALEIQDSQLQIRLAQMARTEDEQTQTKVQNLGQRLQQAKIPEFEAVLSEVESKLTGNEKLADYVSGPLSLRPDWTLPGAVTDFRQSVNRLFNVTLKDRSGAAVTIPEFERLKSEFGSGAWKKREQLIDGIKQARRIINEHYRRIAAGFEPRILGIYNRNLESMGGTPIDVGGGESPPPPPGFKVD